MSTFISIAFYFCKMLTSIYQWTFTADPKMTSILCVDGPLEKDHWFPGPRDLSLCHWYATLGFHMRKWQISMIRLFLPLCPVPTKHLIFSSAFWVFTMPKITICIAGRQLQLHCAFLIQQILLAFGGRRYCSGFHVRPWNHTSIKSQSLMWQSRREPRPQN